MKMFKKVLFINFIWWISMALTWHHHRVQYRQSQWILTFLIV